MDSDLSRVLSRQCHIDTAEPRCRSVPGLFRLRRAWFRHQADYFVLAGGTLLPTLEGTNELLADEHWCRPRRSRIALGLSLGPFQSSDHEDAVVQLLSSMEYVAFRDDFSADWAEQRGVRSQTARAFDLAVLLPMAANLSKPTGERRRRLGVALLGQQFLRDPALLPLDLKLAADLGKETATVAARNGSEVIAFSLCRHPVYDDRIVTQAFVEACRGCPVRTFEHDGDPLRTFERIRECTHFVSMRLHGGVSAYTADVPFLMLSYHHKCRDFVRTIGLDEQFCMSSDKMQLKEYGERLAQLLVQSAVPAKMPLVEAQQRALLNFQVPRAVVE